MAEKVSGVKTQLTHSPATRELSVIGFADPYPLLVTFIKAKVVPVLKLTRN